MTGRLRVAAPRELRLLRALLDLSGTANDDTADPFDRLARHCASLFDVTAAGILRTDRNGDLQVPAASDERCRSLELLQRHTGTGPGPDAYRTGQPVFSGDLTADAPRWPEFAAEAARAGLRSVTSLPLKASGRLIGALDLFDAGTGPVRDPDLSIAAAFAEAAATGITKDRALRRDEALARQLQQALDSRVVIEQAKGLLAQAGDLPVDEAFTRMRLFSRRHGRRLHLVAEEVVRRSLEPGRILDPDSHDERPGSG